jgi:hypothetical protein
MSQTTEQQSTPVASIENSDTESCFCEKKTCALGIASIAIGVGGFIVANLL